MVDNARYYVYLVILDKSIYTSLNDTLYYVGKHKTTCRDLLNDGYFGSGARLHRLYDKYGYDGAKKSILKECKNEMESRLYEMYYIKQFRDKYKDRCINSQFTKHEISFNFDSSGNLIDFTKKALPIKKPESSANYKWFNNGKINKRIYNGKTAPDGFTEGFLRSKLKKRRVYAEYGEKRKMYIQSQKETVLLRSLHIKSKLKQIDILSRKKYSLDEIYNEIKLDDAVFQHTNERLFYVINEKMLIAQIELYPRFLDTICSSLNELYKKEPELQNRLSYEDYLLCSIREDHSLCHKCNA